MKIGYFDNLEQFLWMSGHGPYVWVCVFVTVFSLGLLAILPGMKRRALVKSLTQQYKQQANQHSSLQPTASDNR